MPDFTTKVSIVASGEGERLDDLREVNLNSTTPREEEEEENDLPRVGGKEGRLGATTLKVVAGGTPVGGLSLARSVSDITVVSLESPGARSTTSSRLTSPSGGENENTRLARYEEIAQNVLTPVETESVEDAEEERGYGKHLPIDLRQLSMATPGKNESIVEEGGGGDDSDDEELYIESNRVLETTGGGEEENERNVLTKEGPY